MVTDMSTLERVEQRAAWWVCGSRWLSLHKYWNKYSEACMQELH